MKKKLQLIALTLLALNASAQSFQKLYGDTLEVQPAQYAVYADDDGNIYSAGTLRSGFPEIGYHGTISKFDALGNLVWYKGYDPADFLVLDGYFIQSLFEVNNELFAFGDYATDDGIHAFLQNFDELGNILWSKKIEDAGDIQLCKAAPGNNSIFLIMSKKIAKFNLDGELLAAKQITEASFTARNLYFDSENNLVITGEIDDSRIPIIKFDEDLNFVGGYNVTFAGHSEYALDLTETAENNLIVIASGTSSNEQIIFRIDTEGTIPWGKLILDEEMGDVSFSTIHNKIEPLNVTNSSFGVLSSALYSELDFWKYSALFYQISSDGEISDPRLIDETPHLYGSINPNALFINPLQDAYFIAGNHTEPTANYLQRGKLSELGCGENERPIEIVDITDQLSAAYFPEALITPTALVVSDKAFTSFDVPVNYDNTYCSEGMGSAGIETETANNLLIYPNPTRDFIQLNAGHITSVHIYDCTGRLVMSSSKNIQTWDVSQLPNGIYYLQAQTENSVFSGKFVKE